MSQLQIDAATGELIRTSGTMVRVTGGEEVVQHVRVRLRLFRGEIPYNLSLGMRYVGVILGKGTAPERIEGEFSDMALGTPGVIAVDKLDLDTVASTRTATVDFSGTLDLGDASRRIPIHDRFTVEI